MGQAMAPRLLEAGFDLTVWNRSSATTDSLRDAGARVVAQPADIWRHTDVAISMLRDYNATRSVMEDESGLLAEGCVGKLICDMATYAPADTLALAALANERGARYVDAPVGGTVDPARSGKLVVFTGGSADDTDQLQPILSPLSRRVFNMGQQGNGAKMKMVMNLVLTVYWEAIAEGLAMAEGGGLDPGAVLDVLAETPAALPILLSKKELLLGQSDTVGFDINGVQKDMRAVMRTVAELGLSAPAASGTLDAVSAAASCGAYGDQDVAKLASYRRGQLFSWDRKNEP
ncbi:hypothetical protein BA177_04225 [Woeseia oceani]|uniref:3-hydroxyisobutyrate dehydrogenase n=2 Tax=Woeseia oceani TaxID=1548547 RepID=A0A193LDR5_9GAMM|nr:hypothetical protein BA177_04225 [Woeseia oceani]